MSRSEAGAISWEELLATLEARLLTWEASLADGAYPGDFEWPSLDSGLPAVLEGRARQLLARYHLIEDDLLVRREVLEAALDGLDDSAPSGRPASVPLFVDSHI